MKKLLFILIALIFVFWLLHFGGYISPVSEIFSEDETNHGWGVSKNNEHMQPGVSKSTVDVLSKYNSFYIGAPDKKIIYLTIDLGYESGNTESILDVLRDNDVKATFFITGNYLQKNEEIVKRIVDEGHSLQNHTMNYRHFDRLGDFAVKKEITDLHNAIMRKFGVSMRYLRTPYEEWSERVLKIANDTGYRTVFWSVACVDWVDGKDASYIYGSVMDNYHNGAVILVHAVSKSSPEAIGMIVRGLKQKGFEFMTLGL